MNIPPLSHTLFGKFFYSSSLFTHHTLYKNKVFDIHFSWSYHESADKIWPPFYRSIISTKVNREVIEFDQNRNIISYHKETKTRL
jgi:hypothetical protein